MGLFWDPVKIRPISSILTCTFRFLFGLSPPPPPLPSSLSVVVCYTCSIPCAGICLPCSPKVVCWKQLRLCIPTPSLWFKCLIVITLVIVKNCCLKLEINIFTVYCLLFVLLPPTLFSSFCLFASFRLFFSFRPFALFVFFVFLPFYLFLYSTLCFLLYVLSPLSPIKIFVPIFFWFLSCFLHDFWFFVMSIVLLCLCL